MLDLDFPIDGNHAFIGQKLLLIETAEKFYAKL